MPAKSNKWRKKRALGGYIYEHQKPPLTRKQQLVTPPGDYKRNENFMLLASTMEKVRQVVEADSDHRTLNRWINDALEAAAASELAAIEAQKQAERDRNRLDPGTVVVRI